MSWREVLTEALPSVNAVPQLEPLSLEADVRNVAVARRFVAEKTAVLGDELAHDVGVIASELVTNAVVHARTPLQVAVAVTDDTVVVMVHDLDLGRREEPMHERDGGRGLAIVDELSCAAGRVQHDDGGKTYWARMCLLREWSGSTRSSGSSRTHC